MSLLTLRIIAISVGGLAKDITLMMTINISIANLNDRSTEKLVAKVKYEED